MADLTKEQLELQNSTLFPNNNSGEITATDLRTFNTEMIDNTVNQTVYTADSASFDLRIDEIIAGVPAGTVSGSSQIDYPLISNIPSGIVSGSSQVSDITGSSLVTASFSSQTLTFTKGDGSTFGILIPDESGSNIDTGSFATTGSNNFVGNQTINGDTALVGDAQITGSLSVSKLTTSDIFANPQTLTDDITIPTNRNAMVVGPVSVDGTITIEGDSKLLVIDTPSFIDVTTLATTGSNTFVGNQTITGSLNVIDNTFIISSGSNSVEFNAIFPDNQAGVIFNAPNSKFNATGNFNIQVNQVVAFDAGTRIDLNSNTNVNGNTTLQGTVSITQTMNLSAQDPLPTGAVGDLAVSGSALYFYDGAWKTVSLV